MHIFDVHIFSGAAAVAQLGECQTEDLKAAGFSTKILIWVQVPVEEKKPTLWSSRCWEITEKVE